MADNHLNSKVLGQLLVMQSFLVNLPDEKSVFQFVCEGLLDIPGVANVSYKMTKEVEYENEEGGIVLEIARGKSLFGYLHLQLSDPSVYRLYHDYISNFVFMVAVVLEEQKQQRIILQHKEFLEERILERTQELNQEKEKAIESQRRFIDMMKHVKLISVMLNREGDIVFCNDYLLAMTHYQEKEVLHSNWFDRFLNPSIVPQIKKVFAGVMDGDVFMSNYENTIITKEGESLLISWYNTILYDANKNIIGTASIGENITEKRIVEQELIESKERAEESDRLKTAFLQNLSHEIRTPMNAIMGFSELLELSDCDTEEYHTYSSVIISRCEDLLSIINDILDIAKIESGKLDVKLESLDLNELFDKMKSFFHAYAKRIKKENLQFLVHPISNKLSKSIISDRIKLEQILMNLISNACKNTEQGTIEIGCEGVDMDKILFYVKDTGVGIPQEKYDKIFERFFQIAPEAGKNSSGTGLGLSIVKGIVDSLGGDISVMSDIGKGSTFSFTIPIL